MFHSLLSNMYLDKLSSFEYLQQNTMVLVLTKDASVTTPVLFSLLWTERQLCDHRLESINQHINLCPHMPFLHCWFYNLSQILLLIKNKTTNAIPAYAFRFHLSCLRIILACIYSVLVICLFLVCSLLCISYKSV